MDPSPCPLPQERGKSQEREKPGEDGMYPGNGGIYQEGGGGKTIRREKQFSLLGERAG
jgi:hypothetical protein